MIIDHLRNPIPAHRPNRPRQPNNIARDRLRRRDSPCDLARPPLLRDVAVRSLPCAVFAEDQPFAGTGPGRRFEETGVGWWEGAWAGRALGERRWGDVGGEATAAAAVVVGAGEGAWGEW